MTFIYAYLLLAFVFFMFMTSRGLWIKSSSFYSKVFISLVWPASICAILMCLFYMKSKEDVE